MTLKKVILMVSLCCGLFTSLCSSGSFSAVSNDVIINDYMRSKSLEDALCHFIYECDIDLVKETVGMGADINKNDYYGDLPLYAAVLLSNDESKIEDAKEIVDFLLSKGADPYLTHEKGISVMQLFSMADRSCFKEIFEKYGYFIFDN